tara:strand:+ start:604 stop:861 length:258 start_codon:yes stop_codon:yes gene_type:complete
MKDKFLEKYKDYLFMSCRQCSQDRPDGNSLRDWQRLQVGVKGSTMIIFCERCEEIVGKFQHDLDVPETCDCCTDEIKEGGYNEWT